MKPAIRLTRPQSRTRNEVQVEAVKKLRALGRRLNLRITQAEIRRAITRGQV